MRRRRQKRRFAPTGGMSTTRPLLGMRRVTELTYPEQPSSRLPAAAARQQTEAATVDEFTVLEDKEEELKCAKPRVEQVFKVTFTIIGLLDYTGQPHGSKTLRQIWLQLRGNREDVSKAKVSFHVRFTNYSSSLLRSFESNLKLSNAAGL